MGAREKAGSTASCGIAPAAGLASTGLASTGLAKQKVVVKESRGLEAEVDFHHEDDAEHEDFDLLEQRKKPPRDESVDKDESADKADEGTVRHYESVRSYKDHVDRMHAVLHSDTQMPVKKRYFPWSCFKKTVLGKKKKERKLFLDHEHPEERCLTHSVTRH